MAAAGQGDLIESLGASPLAMVISNPRRPDTPIEAANPAFCALTGYGEDEVVGRNCRFLAGADTARESVARIGAALQAVRPVLLEIVNYRRDGAAFRNGVTITPLFDADGALAWFLGSQVDLGPAGLHDHARAAAQRLSLLSPRRREVLALMARGLLNKQIAWRLRLSEKTVKMHRALLIEQLGVRTSAEAIRLAVEAGL